MLLCGFSFFAQGADDVQALDRIMREAPSSGAFLLNPSLQNQYFQAAQEYFGPVLSREAYDQAVLQMKMGLNQKPSGQKKLIRLTESRGVFSFENIEKSRGLELIPDEWTKFLNAQRQLWQQEVNHHIGQWPSSSEVVRRVNKLEEELQAFEIKLKKAKTSTEDEIKKRQQFDEKMRARFDVKALTSLLLLKKFQQLQERFQTSDADLVLDLLYDLKANSQNTWEPLLNRKSRLNTLLRDRVPSPEALEKNELIFSRKSAEAEIPSNHPDLNENFRLGLNKAFRGGFPAELRAYLASADLADPRIVALVQEAWQKIKNFEKSEQAYEIWVALSQWKNPATPELKDFLFLMAKSNDADQRQKALFLLNKLVGDTREVRDILIEALKISQDPTEIRRVLNFYDEHKLINQDEVDLVLKQSQKSDRALSELAIRVLADQGISAPDVIKTMIEKTRANNGKVPQGLWGAMSDYKKNHVTVIQPMCRDLFR